MSDKRRLLSPMPDEIVLNQRTASDPSRSVWVTANAGSGKTYVLTARVLRLLLSGVRPEEILCLTYTKAAAAEMRGRISERLAKWSLLEPSLLLADLTDLLGEAPATPALQRARTLFAHALETPGGLKIQTIHAFCEAVLHRFPSEAGVPFDFGVLEEHERDGMLAEARERVIASGVRGGPQADAVETLFDQLSDFVIEQAIVEALNEQVKLRAVLRDPAAAKRNLRTLMRVGPGPLREDVLRGVTGGYGPSVADHNALFRLIPPRPGGSDFVDRLGAIDPAAPDAEALFEAYLTQDHTARKTLVKKAAAALIPDVAARLVAEAARLEALHAMLNAAELVERSEAMLDIVAAIAADYENAKRRRSLLDFDDLIAATNRLLQDPAHGPWVRYKLDAGISHILVDEGQDTNPQQWDVVKALIDDFFSGESAADRPRTLFAVGDQKQSIFSFQGADPQVFLDTGIQTYFSARTVQLELAQVPLRHSFRTLPNILEAVDEVFKSEALAAGVLDPGMTHRTARADRGGSVTLWPPTQQPDDNSAPDEWATEPADGQLKGAPRQVAERIASAIDNWLREGRRLATRDVPIRPDDILILVQVRSVLFHEIIRALNQKAIPTPGADRLAVTTHIGVLDLMALGDVLANVSDDLQLAALLRSPLFDVSEEDLFEVAHGRSGWLWMAMEASANPQVRAAYRQLSDWRRLNLERPFDFYSEVLYAGGGLKRMRARFGAEIDDVLAEFLDLALHHENEGQPSLLGFLAELRSRDVTIKRELGESGGVRVMTVHGAKGLEAPIVILADAATTEEGRDRRSIYMAETPLFFHASSKATHAPQTMGHKDEADAAREAEYWRKLYVAMTRAEDELYVTGYLTKARKGDGSWYRAIESALAEASDVIADAQGETLALIFPKGMAAAQAAAAAANDNTRPDASFALSVLPRHSLRRIVRPSSAADDAAPEEVLVTDAERSAERDPDQARHEGTALHALLHHLLKLPRSDWEGAALRALPELLPQWPDAHARLAAKAVSILSAEKHQRLFGSSSRGEVPVLAMGTRNGEKVTIAGRIDRLVVEPGKVTIIDYKSDAREPASAAHAPKAYLTQLGLYARIAGLLFPDHGVEAAILWTGPETLMILPPDLLRNAVAGFTIG